MKKKWKVALMMVAGLLTLALPADADAATHRESVSRGLRRRGATGEITVRAGRRRFPAKAEVSLARTHADNIRSKIKNGLKNRRGVLAMYDIAIRSDGRKWQPDAGDPVRVEVDLEEPVSVATCGNPSVAHLADDGTVEELPVGRYGFAYTADKTAIKSFWFDASGFSVYAIVDGDGELVAPRRFYHFYDHPQHIDGSNAVKALPYIYNDQANDLVNVQIAKDGDSIKEPPIPPDIFDDEGRLVSMFEGWYVVGSSERPSGAVESKLDPANEYFQFVWPTGVTDNRLSFTNVVSVTETVDTDYFVVPLYEHARFLQFNESAEDAVTGGAHIIDRKLIAINDESGWARVKVSDVTAALVNSRQEYFCGWRYRSTNGQWKDLIVYDADGKPQEEYITIDNPLFEANGGTVIPFYPIYVSAHFLSFDTNAKGSGATYVGSIFVRSTSEFSNVTPSGNRLGYDFAGWCAGTVENGKVKLGERITDASGRAIPNVTARDASGAVTVYTDANGVIRLNKDVTLYASWIANTSASFRVIVWQQRVTDAKNAADSDKKYFYVTHYTSPVVSAATIISGAMVASFTGTRADGESISATNLKTLSGLADTNAANEDFTGFHYARWVCEDETVASDGSTVVNVYYDRDLITLRFSLYDSSQTETTYSTTASTSGEIYGTDDGESYFAVYYNDGQWYKTRTSWQGYAYSTQFTGTRYVRSGTNWLGQPEYSQATDNEGEQYRRTGAFLNYTYHKIYYNEDDDTWYENREEVTNYAYSDPYSGYRYTVSTSNWIVNQTMTGLYGQTLAANGYTWPSSRRWYDGSNGNATSGTQISFLDAFLPTSGGDETYYSTTTTSTSSSNTKVYFYKENLDGSWLRVNEFDSGSSSVNFNISDKYNGFQAYQYSTDGESSWKSVGTYNESTHYYGSQVSSSKLSIRFKRKTYELIYKDGDATVYDTGKSIPYESSLVGCNLGLNDSRLDWGGRDTSVGTFEGWYEDASLTVPFDFTATMPDGKKFLYAKWAPIKYKVVVDPNGGEMQSGDSTWFYLDAGEKLFEYNVTRNYRLDMHNGTFYYHHDLWDPVKDKHTDQYDPSTDGAPRRAYYTPDIAEATSNEVSNPENRYSYEPKAYAFMGWYEVHDDGTLATDPFSFGDPPNRPVAIRALWRRTGVYTLKYESVDPDGQQPDQTINDPEDGVEGGYIDDAVTTLAKDPTNYDKKAWVWEGWQVVDTYNGNIPLTDIRSPGDVYVVHETHADKQNVIHFRAVYKSILDGSSRHIPNVTDLVLDSNENARLAAGASLLANDGRTGMYTDGSAEAVEGLNQGVWFAGQQNNFSVDLDLYSSMFAHDSGYFLLGWDSMRHVDSLIPAYTAVQTIGVDTMTDSENTLYATWEPQIYIEFANETGDDLVGIQLYIPSWVDGELFRVNTVTGTYGRTAFTAFEEGTATFDLATGETLRLVLPDGADRDFAVFGNSTYDEGTKLVVTRIEPQIAGQETTPTVEQSVYPGENYMVSGTMKVSPTPVRVRFTKTTYPAATDVAVRYFLHDPNGTVTEITNDSGSWDSFNSVKKTLAGISVGTNDIACLLQKSLTEGVHELLSSTISEQYGYTTIGIGAATGDFNEWRSITKSEPSGGSYIRFLHEKLEWSRYSHVWNAYENAAVYVVFYKRIPVHVTVAETVVGTEDDKDRPFAFTAVFEEHSRTFEYTVTTTYKKSRTVTRSRTTWLSNWSAWSGTAWENCEETIDGVSTATPVELTDLADADLFPQRASAQEEFSLKNSERHPITLYFNRDDAAVDSVTSPEVDSDPAQSADLSSSGLDTRQTATQTRTYSQTVTFRVTYQYEMATISQAAHSLYNLASMDGEAGSGHGGQPNLTDRSYTISSIQGPDLQGFYTYTPLDTAIFTNTRKTGSLTVTKTVVDGEAGDTFPFIVTLGETVVDKDSYTTPAGVHLGPYGKVFTFSLANGGSQTLTGLPAGASYVVEEAAHEKYIATVTGDNASGAITESGTTVAYVNKHKTELAIAMKDRSVIFTGAEQHGHEISTVTGTGAAINADGYTLTGLKSGHVLTVEHYVVPHGVAVGSYTGHVENVRFTVRDANDGDRDVSDEYIITMTPGTLTIEPTPIAVTVTGNHETRVYDGTEQELQGYTYVITHAMTHEVITNENVYVAIPPDYQTAWRRDVGRSDMSLGANHVIVTVPEGMSVSQVVVAENGWLEITPAPVTVKADDKFKILNRADPPLTATVTGLFGSDTVEYALSREAGEASGAYAITVAGDEFQGNYRVAYEPGTLTIEELELIQRASGSGVPVSVPVTDELIDALGFDSRAELSASAVGEVMNKVDPNGLRRWENLVTGTATNQLLLCTAVDATGTSLTFRLSEDPARHEDLGYIVLHELRKHTRGGWSRLPGVTDEQVPAFPLDSEDITGYYRIVTQIVPVSNLAITNEISTTNIVGVLRIASAATHTMASVPFIELPRDPALNEPVKVSDYIGNGFLSDGDALRLREDGVFKVWAVENGKFVPYVSVSKGGGTKDIPSAEDSTIDPGRSVWVTRTNQSKPLMIVGQFTGEPVEVEIAGASEDESGDPVVSATMVTNPNMEAIKVNDIDWGDNPVAGTDGDAIEIPSAIDGAMSTRLTWSSSKGCWGKSMPKKVGSRFVQTFVSDFEIPPGLGFWYYRTSGKPFKVMVKGAQTLD